MKKALLIASAIFLGITAVPSQASTILFTWVNSGNSNTNVGNSYSQTSSGITLTAYGLILNGSVTSPANASGLYAKNGGSGETGLGMSVDPGGDHEINASIHDGIQIDFSSVLAAQPNATVTMGISSAQTGEGWALYGSNTLLTVDGPSKTQGLLGEPLLTGTGTNSNPTTSITLPDWGQYSYYTLMATGTAPDANVLLGTLTITGSNVTTQATPEPGSLLMAGTALIVLGAILRKRQKKA